MLVTLPSGDLVHCIGDPHLGRAFQTGVHPSKRGLREARQRQLFKAELNTQGVRYIIMMGDLVDHPNVGYKIVVDAAEDALEAALANPNITYVFIAGNHDLARNISVVGAFDTFEEIVKGRCENLIVVRTPTIIDDQMLMLPWQWGVPAMDQLAGLVVHPQVKTVFCHCDLQSFGGDDSHLCPTKELHALGITEIYSGHYHIEGAYPVSGHVVHCTGSLEPYSHGEDPNGDIYVTLSLEEATDGRDLSDKVVRVVLADGEEIPDDIDCMALTAIKAVPEQNEADQAPLGKFEWKTVLEEALADLDPEVRAFIEERLTT
jgi:DNA repair exonuclease SbcCD nuclease subunit